MRNYATLFDYRYLPQGLAMFESLRRHSSVPVILHVLPMDEACKFALLELSIPGIVVIIDDFESKMGLRQIKASRTHQEYCWTCASNLCEYLQRHSLGEITYLDADLFFFSDPEPVFAEIGSRSIAITPHRLIPSKKHLEVNGRYNVGWVTFRGAAGFQCAKEWAEAVRGKCSAVNGCGDQLYLDAWPGKYGAELFELGIGVNVAPWNIGQWALTEGPRVDDVPVVCYHFHEYIHGARFTNYELRQVDRDLIYSPYVYAVGQAKERAEKICLQLQAERC